MSFLKHYHINETLANVIPQLFTQLEAAAFDFGIDEDAEDAYIKDGAFIVEAVRALLCKYHRMEHPFTVLAQNVFTDEGAEIGTLRVVDAIDLKFKNPEKGNS